MFNRGETYAVVYRAPTDHRTHHPPLGLALEDSEGRHRAWIKEEDRQFIEPFIQDGRQVEVTIAKLGARWNEEDTILQIQRHYRRGEASWKVV